MAYVDGMLCAVPSDKREAYLEFAKATAVVFKSHGATKCVDNWGHDVPHGQVTDLHRAVQATETETVVFSWVTWPDKATRDSGWEKVMADPRMAEIKMPFDGKRMIYGGFEPLYEA